MDKTEKQGEPKVEPKLTPEGEPNFENTEREAEKKAEREAEKERLAQMEKQLADKDRFITELQENNRTLETRINQVGKEEITPGVGELKTTTAEILEEAQIDPQKAGEKLAVLIKDSVTKAQEETLRNLEPLIERQSYIKDIKSKNQDLLDLGLEPAISLRTNQLIQQGKDFKLAVDLAIKEAREKVNKLKENNSIPPSADSERGNNQEPPEPKPEKVPTPQEEIDAELARKRKMGL